MRQRQRFDSAYTGGTFVKPALDIPIVNMFKLTS